MNYPQEISPQSIFNFYFLIFNLKNPALYAFGFVR